MKIPGYQIKRLIAEGGMSTVYLAVQESLARPVAIKVLRKFDSTLQAERFLHEARIIASLEHRNIITIYDVGSVGDRYYIAMEYLENGSLADRIEDGMQPEVVINLLESIAGCLNFVHLHDIVHRDIKPSNILFHADGTPKLTDFGIAKQLDADQETTLEDSALGSPYYLSPEQAEGRALDGRSDIYSLGIVFYQMLTGRKPYAERSHIETIVAHLSNPIPVLPKELSRYQHLLERMIAKRPENRPASAQALVAMIHETRSGAFKQLATSGSTADPGARPGGLVAWLLGTSPASRLAADGLLFFIGLGVAWISGDDGGAPEDLTAGKPAPGIELRYDATAATEARRSVARPAPTLAVPPVVVLKSEPEPEVALPLPVEPALEPDPVTDADEPAVAPEPAEDVFAEVAPAPTEEPIEAAIEAAMSAVTAEAVAPAAEQADEEPLPAEQTTPAEEVMESVEAEVVDTDGDDVRQERIEELLVAAARAMKSDRLTKPADDNAYRHYGEVLKLEPGQKDAEAGMDRIARRYGDLARGALARKKYRLANLYINRGLEVRRGDARLLAIRAEVDDAKAPAVRVAASEPATKPKPKPRESKTVVHEFEDTSITSRGREGTGNIVKDFKNVWRSVFD